MKIELELDDATVRLLRKFIELTASDNNTHGKLTIASLVGMLLEDVCLVMERPGCWEANGMYGLLAGHGYEV